MSKSLAVEQGDLVLGAGRQYEIVSGKAKLFQDLKLHILEHMGTDPAAPGLGTTFEGGFVNGRYIQPIIGQNDTERMRFEIRRQVAEVLRKYQHNQLLKIQRESLQYQGRNTLDANEVLSRVNSIEVNVDTPTQIKVRVVITTIKGEIVPLEIALR